MKRQAFTLIELIAVVALMAIIMGTAVVLIAQLFDYQRNNAEYADSIRAVNRLVADFRSDVRTHGKPEILTDDDTLLRWTTNVLTVEYRTEPGEFPDQQKIIRTVRQEGESNRYETYRLPERSALRFVEGMESDAGLVAMSLWVGTPVGDVPNIDELNPFDRTTKSCAHHWRTIVVRY